VRAKGIDGGGPGSEYLVGAGQALPFGLPVDATGLARGLTTLDQQYVPPFFPRPGFYAVVCFADRSSSGDVTTQCGAPIIGFPTQLNLSISSMENQIGDAGATPSVKTNRSTARFFIPAAPPGQQVLNAQLTAAVFTQSTPDAGPQPRLNGKTPASATMRCGLFFFPFPEGVNCFGTATWDFTEETRALAAGGGGEFTVTPDVMPQFTIFEPTGAGHVQIITVSANVVTLAANYPWFHLGPTNNSLTLTFAAACPHGLNLSATPSSVRPPRPGVGAARSR